MHLIDLAGANMSETSPSSIDIAKMRTALLSSIYSRLHCYGNDEVQLEVLEGSMQRNDLINGFNMESRMFNNDSQLGKGVYTEPSQTQSHSETLIYDFNHHPGSLYGIPSRKDISQQSLLLYKDPFRSQHEGLHVPMRRNQKLSDKVTTLQKLVSPFGKTDTASVLHEASINIKLLQAQIRTLFQMLSFSYFSTIKDPHTQECGDQLQLDLRSRGLCLVPISITEKVTMVDQIHHDSASRIIHS
ncbi:hypothetical protein Fmac_017194 [Flemingia macrophylla]|uniref:BHLH domain-containing protein n=1 Tax=Flemingia macrophylla TaxID=520843 RepID=A0ABD1M246_9FABA